MALENEWYKIVPHEYYATIFMEGESLVVKYDPKTLEKYAPCGKSNDCKDIEEAYSHFSWYIKEEMVNAFTCSDKDVIKALKPYVMAQLKYWWDGIEPAKM